MATTPTATLDDLTRLLQQLEELFLPDLTPARLAMSSTTWYLLKLYVPSQRPPLTALSGLPVHLEEDVPEGEVRVYNRAKQLIRQVSLKTV